MSAFAWATRGRHVSVRRLFAPSRSDKAVAVAERSGLSPLACAAMGGDMPALRAELTNGANVNDASGGGVTALMLASRGNHIEAQLTAVRFDFCDSEFNIATGSPRLRVFTRM